jgi:alkylhydroperoxidase family enzyme
MPDPVDELRAVVAGIPAPPEAMAGYLAKVRDRAYTVTDADIAALRESGLGEDEIFEQTVGAAIAQGLRRLDRANEVLG